ncbi:MAG: nicotinate phosphoribosyltransferase [Azoarcus sp.]|nr:nicotinate phosphoribosyltransferase [Azoarcus sp.]
MNERRALNHREVSAGHGLGLFTDLYELTMVQAYFEQGMRGEAVFSLFSRALPQRRNFLVACGLDTLLDDLEAFRFDDGDIEYLASLDRFSPAFLDWLRDFRFTGAVHAVSEGTPVFADEPLLEVVAPLPEAQLIETLVMNQMQLQTVLATKAQRMVAAAAGRRVLDFGARRMHGFDAALKAARAFHIAGIAATSNVLAGRVWGVPVAGTMAHSYVQAHDDEREALRAFAQTFPDTVVLVDTYDTLAGVRKVIDLVCSGEARIGAVRLDSGDLLELARASRRLLDAAGLQHVGIVASGGLDEDRIAELVAAGAPIEGFGVGSSMGVSDDAPNLDIAYKLCEYDGRGRLKLSSGKPVLPGRKQVFRTLLDGRAVGDVIARADESLAGEPLLHPVMRDGRRLHPPADLDALRTHAQESIARLPHALQALEAAEPGYPVSVSAALREHQQQVAERIRASQ